MQRNFTDILVGYTKHLHKDDPDRTKNLHVTDLTSRCLVGVALEKAGKATKKEVGSGKLLRYEAGHILERYVHDALAHANLLEAEQKTRYEWEEFGLVGSPDCRVTGDVLLEVKSIHNSAFDYMDANPERIMAAHSHYVEQLQTYLSKEREVRPNAIGKLFYISLDGRTAEFTVRYDQTIVDSVMKRASVLKQCLEEGKRPSLLPYFVKTYSKRSNAWVWGLEFRNKYCLSDGIHEKCDPELWSVLEPESSDQMISKLEYQCKKANDNGTNPNDWIDSVLGKSKPKNIVTEDGIEIVPIE